MTYTFKVIKSGVWQCEQHREVTLKRKGRTVAKPFGWAVFEGGREVGDRYLSKALAERAAQDFLAARETAKAYRPSPDDLNAIVAPQLHPVGLAGSHPRGEARYGRVPAAITGAVPSSIIVRAAIDEVTSAALRAVEMASQQAVASIPDETDAELLDRIVRRAKYEALKAMLDTVDGWDEGAREEHEARQLSGPYESAFRIGDVRRMVNDAARECGTAEPYVEPQR